MSTVVLLCSCGKSKSPSDKSPPPGKKTKQAPPKSVAGKTGRPSGKSPKPGFSPGLKVGEKAPAFELTGHDGKKHSLSDLTKSGKVALVFYRSADW